jgi:hypothetical protein
MWLMAIGCALGLALAYGMIVLKDWMDSHE